MSELIPNLEDLRVQLSTDVTSQYAHEFVRVLATAESTEDVASKVDALVNRWLEVPDDHSA